MFSPLFKKGIPMTDTYFCLSTDTKDETDKGNGDVLIVANPSTGEYTIDIFNADGAAGSRWVALEDA